MNYTTLKRTLESAVALHHAGRFDEAEEHYAKVRQAAPKLYDGWYLSGALAFQRGGHLEDAVEFLTRAQRLDRHAEQCQLFLGMALADLGRHAEAEKPLRKALQKLPQYADAWQNLACCLIALDRRTEAIECLQRAVSLEPENSVVRRQLDELLPELALQ